MYRKLGFQPDSAGGHLACLLARQAGKPIFIKAVRASSFLSFRAESRNRLVFLTSVKLSARPFLCLFDRSEVECSALAGLVLLTCVTLSARNETSIAARNRHDLQNRFQKIRATAALSFSHSPENIFLLKHARSRHRSERPADVRTQRA